MSIDISVLVATRHRPRLLERMAHSLTTLADDVDSFEVLLAFDCDDTASLAAFASSEVAKVMHWRATVVPRMGYKRMHEYLTLLAGMSSAPWLMLLGDDAFVKTEGWDAIIRSKPCDRIYNTKNTSDPVWSSSFLMHPVLPRAWVQATGRVSTYSQSDTYLTALGRAVDRIDMSYLLEICHVAESASPNARIDDDVTAEITYSNVLPSADVTRDAGIIRALYA
jgi:hypothetical protein